MLTQLRKEKFLLKCQIDPITGCWIWQGMKVNNGYGRVKRDGKQQLAHRWSWTTFCGPIPEGMFVLHKCDVRACVNPKHLFIGTQLDNGRDMVAKGRHLHGEKSKTSKLKEADIFEIYRLHESGMGTIRLAAKFKITKNMAWMIVRGKSWKHLYATRYGSSELVRT
jgi:hypothetical protein